MSVQSEINRITQNVSDTYSVLNDLGADTPETYSSDNLSETAASVKAVLYGKAQSLTDEEKAQARANIGVEVGGGVNEIVSMTADEYEAMTTEEKAALYASGVRVIAVDGELDPGSLTDKQMFADFVYPVGSIVNLTIATNPATLWGFGTWESYMPGRVLIGAGTADSGMVYTAGQTGGEEKHTLSIGEIPSHNHYYEFNIQHSDGTSVPNSEALKSGLQVGGVRRYRDYTDYTGGSQPHNNMQPYGVVYRWLRTA